MPPSEDGRQKDLYTYESFSGNGKKQAIESHFLWWCAGAYQQLLKDCPSEHSKYAGLGGTILATFVLAALSAGYAIYSVFDKTAGLWASGFALIWGLIIFNFDRLLVATMRKYGVSRRRQLYIALPRIALALLIGVTIARPLEPKIFEKEIDVQVAANRHQKILQNDSLLQIENRNVLTNAQQERDPVDWPGRQIWKIRYTGYNRFTVQEVTVRAGRSVVGSMGLMHLKQAAYQSATQQYDPELHQFEPWTGAYRY